MDYKAAFLLMCANDKNAWRNLFDNSDPTLDYLKDRDISLSLALYEGYVLRKFHDSFEKISINKPNYQSRGDIEFDLKDKRSLYGQIESTIDDILNDHDYNNNFHEYFEREYPHEIYFLKIVMIRAVKQMLQQSTKCNRGGRQWLSYLNNTTLAFGDDRFLVRFFLEAINTCYSNKADQQQIDKPLTFKEKEVYLQSISFLELRDIASEDFARRRM